MSQASVKSVDSVHTFAHDLSEIGQAFIAATSRVADATFRMDSLAEACVSRVYAAWQQAILDLEQAERDYDTYASMDAGGEEGQIDLTEYREALRAAAEAEREAHEDYNAIVASQASLKGYMTQLYSNLSGAGTSICAGLESASDKISRAAFHLDDYLDA